MRLVIDMQGVQTGSRFRGIGRYTLSLTEAILKNSKEYEIILLLYSYREETYDEITKLFSHLIDEDNIKICYIPKNINESNKSREWSKKASEIIREHFIYQLKPDFLLITTLFEGYGEDFLCSINNSYQVPTAVIFYDLIPLMNEKKYLADKDVYTWYMNKVEQLTNAQLLLSISESARQEALEYLNINNKKVINISTASDSRFYKKQYSQKEKKIILDKFGISKKYLMYSGATDERKNHLRLIEAFSLLPKKILDNYQLVFAGGMPEENAFAFRKHAKSLKLNSKQLILTEKVSDEELNCLYNLCTVFVFPSWHEGFGLPALEAMQCHKAVIASNTSSLPEVIGREDALFDPFDIESIKNKIFEVLTDNDFRISLEQHSIIQSKKFSWDITAKKAIQAIEELTIDVQGFCKKESVDGLISNIANIEVENILDEQIREISECIWKNNYKKQLLIDISELIKYDSKTGIQRVVRSCLSYITISEDISNYFVVPIYQDLDNCYRYFNGIKACNDDMKVQFFKGDIYLCLDLLHPSLVVANQELYKKFKALGITINFVVYDIIPIIYPEYANDGVSEGHKKWLDIILKFSDKLICISKSVKSDVEHYILEHHSKVSDTLKLEYFHLGADINNSNPSFGFPNNYEKILKQIKMYNTFLLVGTLEPRKGHKQTLEAFEQLWSQNIDINLVMVGKVGWLVDDLVKKIKSHPELNKRLFFLEGISDEYLDKVYSASTCLIVASESEGFGLPLIEAAQKKKPIIARDIPVFREVAGEYAFYFPDNKTSKSLAENIKEWLFLYENDKHPKSDNMPWLTWEESTKQLLKNLGVD